MQLSDSGVYTCVARSQAGFAELSYDVRVQGKTKPNQFFTFSSSNTLKISFRVCFWTAVPPGVDNVDPVEPVTVVQGSLVTLTCEARGVPPPTLTWMKDGQPLSLHRNLLLDGEETRLQLPDVAPSDGGLYSCVASNQAGSSTKSFNLTVFGKTVYLNFSPSKRHDVKSLNTDRKHSAAWCSPSENIPPRFSRRADHSNKQPTRAGVLRGGYPSSHPQLAQRWSAAGGNGCNSTGWTVCSDQ